jgi:PIN domain nuclease of toxin-antitoxin system
MRLLLDTHVLLWALVRPERLDAVTRAALEDPANDVLFSAASIWEIAIKARLGRADFPQNPDQVAAGARATGFAELAVRAEAAARVADLPLHHRDPFDRLLVAQALCEPARLITADPQLPPYSELVSLIARPTQTP